MIRIDTSTEFGARVRHRLDNDLIVWLVTTDGKGTPQPSPVWFLPHGESILVYSRPNTAKLRNIERNPRVALHFDGDDHGGNIVIMTGTAVIDRTMPSALEFPAYLAKYADGIQRLSMTSQSFAAAYSVPILVEPLTLRGF
ncbi:MAG: TIGR03667 family PPOX class F420-dependent oxidoreductase [Thermomicrobiales bacterium]